MRILVEALCAEFGGIRTYVEHLLRVWPDCYPDDEVHVLLRSGSSLPTDPRLHRHELAIHGPDAIGRPLAQTLGVRRFAAEIAPDAILATLPSTTVLDPAQPTVVVVYDLRHELRPEQFSRQSRLLRALSYRRGYQIADGIISISQRSLDDLHRLHPRTRRVPGRVAHLGADHVDTWPRGDASGPVITFGHHSNKNIDLILDGWQRVVDGGSDQKLLVLGVGGAHRPELERRIGELGISEHVELAPFLSDPDFQRTFGTARMVLFPSDFEGFGLPVAEAMRLSIPVVIGPEAATMEVAGGHATVLENWTPDALADATRTALELTSPQLETARRFAERYTWSATAATTRSMLDNVVGRG